MKKLYTVRKNNWELTKAQIMNSLLPNLDFNWKKLEKKNTRSFRYGLNQIPYDYTVEVRNRLKRVVLIDRVPEELLMEACTIIQKAGSKTTLRKINARKQ